jgi:CDP-diacylglycerol--glycerol-3-phosphate 3-phosphatidyltransferase
MSYFINLLTLSRIFLAVLIFLLLTRPEGYFLAFILFFLAGVTDYFDGYLARRYKLTSQIGEILDPIADKILIIFVLFGLSVNLESYLIAFIAALIITREIWVGALRDLNARQGRSDATKVTLLAKIKTTIQLFTISIYLLGLTLNNMLILVVGDIFLIVSVLITIYTGYVYTYQSIAPNKK